MQSCTNKNVNKGLLQHKQLRVPATQKWRGTGQTVRTSPRTLGWQYSDGELITRRLLSPENSRVKLPAVLGWSLVVKFTTYGSISRARVCHASSRHKRASPFPPRWQATSEGTAKQQHRESCAVAKLRESLRCRCLRARFPLTAKAIYLE